ncbi:MAG: phosphotransferase [Chloroflexi bacterium]|nr:phosphotransferase [Chloroflexota bacterium]
MTPTIAEQIESLPASDLTPIVRNVLNDDTAKITGSWTADPIGAVHNDLRTEAILKVSGQATTTRNAEPSDWHVILKVMRKGEARNSAAAHVRPETELALYRSRALDDRSSGLRPARCYGWVERDDDVIWLWLEDLSGAKQPPWIPENHLAAARDAGRLNGSWPSGLDRSEDWFIRDVGVKRWDASLSTFEILRARAEHPKVRAEFPPALMNRALALESTLKRLRIATDTLPRCFSHGDCHARNLFPPDQSAGRTHTVAVDWAGAGTDVLGIDGGTLAGSSLTWGIHEAEQTLRIEHELFESYLSGLQEAGRNGERQIVRAGYMWALANYVRAFVMVGTSLAAEGLGEYQDRQDFVEGRFGRPYQEIPAALAAVFEQCLPIIDEADALLDELDA